MSKKLTDKLTPLEKTLGWCYWIFQLLCLPVALQLLNGHFGAPLTATELNLLYFALNFVITVLILFRFVGKSCAHGIRHIFRTLRAAGSGFVVYWILSIAISWLIITLRPDFANANDGTVAQMVQEQYFLTALCTVVLVPVAEELLYRGIIFGTVYTKSKILAYIVSTVIFAAVHIVGYIPVYDLEMILLCFLQYLPAGVCLGWAYAWSGSILAPIFMHVAINQIAILSMR